jgi:hypothetical protein
MSIPKLKDDPRILATCPIDNDRWITIRVGVSKGKVVIDLRAYLRIGSRTARTAAGIYFPIDSLPKVIEAMQRANVQIKTWEIGDD